MLSLNTWFKDVALANKVFGHDLRGTLKVTLFFSNGTSCLFITEKINRKEHLTFREVLKHIKKISS